MLILSRDPGQSLIIGDDIKSTIHKVQGFQVTIRIEATRSLSVHREEIWLRIKQEALPEDARGNV